IQYRGGQLTFDHLNIHPVEHTLFPSGTNGKILTLDEVDARHIRLVLEKTNGRINGKGGAAELLCLHPNTLRFRMDKLGISYGKKSKLHKNDSK
ncbi:MAG: sigma-54-dependent Fis family transcriptional regulator, partial [Desulfobacterium sp.]|nr:sigma-54-dependent Fis family transcriptional regulator [Desulfobacterium sp.]